MIYLVYHTRAESDLVAVAGVAAGSCSRDRSLRELARKSFAYRLQRISRTCDSHCGVSISSSAQRVSDASAETCRRSSERLYLSRMVVCFILEEEEPRLILTVNCNVHFDRARIDLLGLIELLESAAQLEILNCNSRKIHQAYRLGAAEQLAGLDIVVKSILQYFVLELHIVDDSAECRMPAVIGPVCVDHFELCDGRLPVLGISEVVPAHSEVSLVHCKPHVLDVSAEHVVCHMCESDQSLDLLRDVVLLLKSLRLVKACFPCLNRVDHITLDSIDVGLAQIAVQSIDSCELDSRPLALRQDLDALLSRVSSLIELSRKSLNSKNACRLARSEQLVLTFRSVVQLRLSEHLVDAVVKKLRIDVLSIISVEYAHLLEALDPEQSLRIALQRSSLIGQPRLLLHIYSKYHIALPFLF